MFQCPVPDRFTGDRVTLAHGEGGRCMRQWIERRVAPLFRAVDAGSLDEQSPVDPVLDDSALVQTEGSALRMTTDAYVVSPRWFPGGDLGALSIHGTVNDLAVGGARPRWISLSMILEEGIALSEVEALLGSAAEAARASGVRVVTGDTKVVPRGAADGMYVSTAGVGEVVWSLPGCDRLEAGDALLVSGPVGCHGLAVLAAREQLQLDPSPRSDVRSLWPAVERLWRAGMPVRAMRDATRGGVAAVLHEWAAASQTTLRVQAREVPTTAEVRGACELLGLDPLHMACEGAMVVAVPRAAAAQAMAVLREVAGSERATIIGEVTAGGGEPVLVRRALAAWLPLDEPQGMPLPRIC
jgi:hydrogenase expression/formation protein HypE